MEDTCEVHFGGHVDEIEINGRQKFVTRDYYTISEYWQQGNIQSEI